MEHPIKQNQGEWTIEQKKRDYEASHLDLSSKYALASMETPRFTAHSSKSVLAHLNCVGLLNFESEEELKQNLTELHENFFSAGLAYDVIASPVSKPTSTVEILNDFRLASKPEKPLLSDWALPFMYLDTAERPHSAPQFRPDHPAQKLRIVTVEDENKSLDFARILFTSFHHTTFTEEMLQEHAKRMGHVKKSVAPFLHSFVGYEDDKAAVAGTCILSPARGVGALFEVGSMPEFRSKGYGAKIFSHIVEFIISAGYSRILLAASEDGLPVYKRQGFVEVDGSSVHYFSTN